METVYERKYITVRELIQELSKHDGDSPVVVEGYEWGYETPDGVEEIDLIDGQNDSGESHGGPFDTVERKVPDWEYKEFKAVLIKRHS